MALDGTGCSAIERGRVSRCFPNAKYVKEGGGVAAYARQCRLDVDRDGAELAEERGLGRGWLDSVLDEVLEELRVDADEHEGAEGGEEGRSGLHEQIQVDAPRVEEDQLAESGKWTKGGSRSGRRSPKSQVGECLHGRMISDQVIPDLGTCSRRTKVLEHRPVVLAPSTCPNFVNLTIGKS